MHSGSTGPELMEVNDGGLVRSGNFSYCFNKQRTFFKHDGERFCFYLGLTLLRGSTLREPHNLYNPVLPVDLRDDDRNLIWEAGFDKERNKKPGYCNATSLAKMTPETQSLPCSHQLGYICRKQKLPRCTDPRKIAKNFTGKYIL
ncbi:uncharacterized protein LOC144139796 [Haemaphysalis longicornis]